MATEHSPTVVVIGGPNGAGKSTLAEDILPAKGIDHFVNADTIAKGISRFAPQAVAATAGRIMIRRLHELAAARNDFAFETTLAGRGHAAFLRDLAAMGYRIELTAVWLRSAGVSQARVEKRVASGGHDIPLADIRRRFGRSSHNLLQLYIPLADSCRYTGPLNNILSA